MTTYEQGPIAGKLEADDTGWVRDEVWLINVETSGQFGDDAIGDGFEAYYSRGDERIDIAYYVQPASKDRSDPEGEVEGYDIVEVVHTWKKDGDDAVQEDYEYDYPLFVLCPTQEEAEKKARQFAMVDSRCFFLT